MAGGTANRETGTTNPAPTQGYAGGSGYNSGYESKRGGGGGGAGAVGYDGGPSSGDNNKGDGGIGVQVLIAGPPASDQPVGTPGPASGGGYFAGGGAGGTQGPTHSEGGKGGGANGGDNGQQFQDNPVQSIYSTGGGGGGGGPSGGDGSKGSSGIVVVRYQVADLTATQKASGGAISYYGGKTIHTFTSSGTFATNANWSAATVEYVIVAGGGAGYNNDTGGGGGAGGYRTGTTPIGAHPVSTVVQVGAGGAPTYTTNVRGTNGGPSYFGTPLTATGGGAGGGGPSTADGNTGGSGGGAGYQGSGWCRKYSTNITITR